MHCSLLALSDLQLKFTQVRFFHSKLISRKFNPADNDQFTQMSFLTGRFN